MTIAITSTTLLSSLNIPPPTPISTLSLHDALPISLMLPTEVTLIPQYLLFKNVGWIDTYYPLTVPVWLGGGALDRKSTRLNSSHRCISYAVFCLKKKKTN